MVSSAIGYVAPMAVNLVLTPLLLRGLGPAAYGLQSFVAVLIGYLTVMDMGLDLPITKYLAEDRAKTDRTSEIRLLSGTLQLYAAIGLAGLLAMFCAANWLTVKVFTIPVDLRSEAVLVFRLAGVGFLGSVGMSWGRAVAMGLQRFDLTYGVVATANIIGGVLGLAAVYAGFGVVGYVAIRVCVTIASVIIYFLIAKKLLPGFRVTWGFDRQVIERVRGFVGYAALNRVISNFAGRLDQTLIGVYIGVAAAGAYSVPFMVVGSLGYMLSYTLGFVFPMASELESLGERDRLRNVLVRASGFITALGGMVFVPVVVLGDLLLEYWVPTIAPQITGVISLLSLAAFVTTVSAAVTNNAMVGTGRMGMFTSYSLARSSVLAVACLLLIRSFGLLGAASAVLLTSVTDVAYLLLVMKRCFHISAGALVGKAYARPVMLGAGLGVALWWARPLIHTWPVACAAIAAYEVAFVALGFAAGVFGETERRAIAELGQIAKRSVAQIFGRAKTV